MTALLLTTFASSLLVSLGILFAQSADANAWLQKLVCDPVKVSFTTLVSFAAVFFAPFALWLQGLFKENRDSIEKSNKESSLRIEQSNAQSDARIDQSNAQSDARIDQSNARIDQSNARIDRSYQTLVGLYERGRRNDNWQ